MEIPEESTLAQEGPAGNCEARPNPPSLPDLFFSFLRLGVVSFGGPAMVAYIGRLAVARREWLREREFRAGVALCQAMPGATAMQTAAYVGLRSRGFAGGILAYVGFGLPGFALMLALSFAYRQAHGGNVATAALSGLHVIVVAMVANATWLFGRSSIRAFRECAVAAAAATLFLIVGNPLPIIAGSALAGMHFLGGHSQAAERTSSGRANAVRAIIPPAAVLVLAFALTVPLLVLDRRLGVMALVMMKVELSPLAGDSPPCPSRCTNSWMFAVGCRRTRSWTGSPWDRSRLARSSSLRPLSAIRSRE